MYAEKGQGSPGRITPSSFHIQFYAGWNSAIISSGRVAQAPTDTQLDRRMTAGNLAYAELLQAVMHSCAKATFSTIDSIPFPAISSTNWYCSYVLE